MIDLCKFCGRQYRIQMYCFDCDDCHVKYMAEGDKYSRNAEGQVICIESRDYHILTFNLQDPTGKLGSIVVDVRDHNVTIWAPSRWNDEENKYYPQKNWKFPNIDLPDINPNNALSIANRLVNLIVFS